MGAQVTILGKGGGLVVAPLVGGGELAVVAADDAERVLSSMRKTEEGRDAAIIGRVSAGYPGKLVIDTTFGGKRILQKLTGAQLPRICRK